jgi:hypothetical protein
MPRVKRSVAYFEALRPHLGPEYTVISEFAWLRSNADIVVLTPRSGANSQWREGVKCGRSSLTWSTPPGADEVQV